MKPLLNLFSKLTVKGLAHITGGGLLENLPRVMPQTTRAVINPQSWSRPQIFDWLQQQGNIDDTEMYRTFNCGIGMAVILADEDVEQATTHLNQEGIRTHVIGTIEACTAGDEPVVFRT